MWESDRIISHKAERFDCLVFTDESVVDSFSTAFLASFLFGEIPASLLSVNRNTPGGAVSSLPVAVAGDAAPQFMQKMHILPTMEKTIR